MMWGYWGGPSGGGLMMLGMVIFWVAVVVIGVSLMRGAGRHAMMHAGRPHEDSALEIVKRRYAQGEISREEFERLMEDLRR